MMIKELMPYQRVGVKFLKENDVAYLADDMGLGKTIQAVVAVRDLRLRNVLVITTASTKTQWQEYLKKYASSAAILRVETYAMITKVATLQRLLGIQWDVVIYDEAHKLKNPKSLQARAVLASPGIGDSSKRHWFLSGTPMPNRPIELWGVLARFFPEHLGAYKSYVNFGKKFCNGYWDRPAGGYNMKGATCFRELGEILSKVMLRRTKEEVLDCMGDVEHYIATPAGVVEPFSPDNADEANYHAYQGDLCPRERRESAVASLDFYAQTARRILRLWADKLVVFGHHDEVIKGLASRLEDAKIPYVTIQGDTSQARRTEATRIFTEEPDCKVFLGSITACGEGLNLQVAHHMLLVETHWACGQVMQAVDRIRRIGQSQVCKVYFPVVSGSQDGLILATAFNKKSNIDRYFDEAKKTNLKEILL